MAATQFDLLKTKRFFPLFLTQLFGGFSDNIFFKNALVILITYRLTEYAEFHTQIIISLAAGIFVLPFFLFSALAGQLADKYEKSLLISTIKFLEIFLMLFAGLGLYLQSVPLLMIALFALGTHATFYGPLKFSILPEQLQENELISGNALMEAGMFTAILLGTLCGGIFIVKSYGDKWIASTILIAAVCGWLSSLFITKTRPQNSQAKISFNFIHDSIGLIKKAEQRWDVMLIILAISWFWLVGATFLAEFPVFVKNVLHANNEVVTYFLLVFSIGSAIGALCCNRLLKGKIEATYAPLGALGISIFSIDLFLSVAHINFYSSDRLISLAEFMQTFTGWRISFDLFMIAFSGGIYTVPLYTMLQHRTHTNLGARVFAINNMVNALFMVGAALTSMLLIRLGFNVTQLFLLVAVANLFVALYICKLLPDVLIKGFFSWLLTTLYRVKVNGLENYAKAGERVVIVANHTSYIDLLLLATFLPDKLTFAVNRLTAKRWWIKFFLSLVDAYEVDPTNPMALKSLIEFVEKDKRCVIFPEGRLTTTGALMKIYESPGLVADKSGAELLPIRIQGAQHTPFSRLKGKTRIWWTPNITITIFPPQTLDIPNHIKGRKRRQQIGYKLYDVMTEMMFESSNYHRSLFDSLLDSRKLYGARYEIVEDIERAPLNYQQLIMRSFILGNIIAKNTKPGDPVGVLLPNANTNVVTFFALHAFCRVPAMLNYSTGPANVASACHTAQIKIVYTSRKFVAIAKLQDMIAAIQDVNVKVVFLEDLRNQITLSHKLRGFIYALFPRMIYRLLNRSPQNKLLRQPDADAAILFTSGSEGSPKGVVLSHSNILANRYQMTSCVDFSTNDVALNALPMFHSFGLTAGTLLAIFSGVKLFLYPSPLHYRIVPELAYDINASVFFGTDTFLSGYAKYAHPYDFYNLRYIFAGAEKLRDETRITWAYKFGVRIFEGYGTTETSPVVSTNTPMQNKIGTVGRLFPGMRYKLRDVPGIEEGGVLCLHGPNVMKGYLLAENPGVLQPPVDGWYDTGDVVTVDEGKFITIKGRVKRFAKIAGEMVSLAMIEQHLNALWPDFQHAIINMPDTKKGEQIVLLTTYSNANRSEIVSYAKQKGMAEIAIPKNILYTENMPLLGAGKIDYPAARRYVEANLIPEVEEVLEEDCEV